VGVVWFDGRTEAGEGRWEACIKIGILSMVQSRAADDVHVCECTSIEIWTST
jgi:hypothetical protein